LVDKSPSAEEAEVLAQQLKNQNVMVEECESECCA